MRAIWKGSISFGLVNIPVSLYAATRSEELTFRLLRAGDLSPVNYKRVAEADGKEVPWEKIVKGYEYQKGQFVVLKEEDFRRVDIEATRTVDLIDFVDAAEIPPIFFQKPYYMEPQKSGAKAYALLREALQGTGKVGIAKVVIKTREHLAALKPYQDLLLLELMHFADELSKTDSLQVPKKLQVSQPEMNMARALIEQMTEKWDPARYKDDYRSALLEMIREKVKSGGQEPKAVKSKAKAATNVVDLAGALERSLQETQKKGGHRPVPSRSSHRKKVA
jgi:DNA end-binding protein Ku